MKEKFTDWYLYNSETNQQVIKSISEIGEIPQKVVEIFGHILMAHKIWLKRMASEEVILEKPWDQVSSEEFLALNNNNFENTLLILKEQELSKKIIYSKTKGQTFSNNLEEILFHILTHSSYHRGQIAILLRQEKFEPPLTDFIFFKR